MRCDWDAVVVGAGPAGCRAATALAEAGIDTCMMDPRGPDRDTPIGELLSANAVEHLHGIGIDLGRPLCTIREARIVRCGAPDPATMTGPSMRELRVVERGALERSLVQRAQTAGVTLVQSSVQRLDPRPGGVSVLATDGGNPRHLSARYVVVASGATALPAGATSTATPAGAETGGSTGYAWCARMEGVDEEGGALDVFAPVLRQSAEHAVTWSWFAPDGDGNGVLYSGLFGTRVDPRRARKRLHELSDTLAAMPGRYRGARLRGPLRGGRIGSGYAPSQAVGRGVLIVGDAAGLCNPFLGEGIGAALESASLAAHAIGDACAGRTGDPAAAYADALAARYLGFFEAGRHALRRYRLASRVVTATVGDRTPLFHVMRRSVVASCTLGYPPALAAETATVRSALGDRDPLVAGAMREVDDILLSTLRIEWPYLADLALVGQRERSLVLRPSLVAVVAGVVLGAGHAEVSLAAAAVDLAVLAAMAALSIGTRPTRDPEAVDWGNVVATLCVEFCAAHSLVTGRRAGAAIDRTLRDGATALALSRLGELTDSLTSTASGPGDSGPAMPSAGTGASLPASFADLLYEQLVVVPASVGALAAGAGRDEVEGIERWGRVVARAAMVVDARRLLGGGWSRFGLDLSDSLAKRTMRSSLVQGGAGARRAAAEADRALVEVRRAGAQWPSFPGDVRHVLAALGAAVAHAQGYGAFERPVEREEAVTT